jgi:hypothetical protein
MFPQRRLNVAELLKCGVHRPLHGGHAKVKVFLAHTTLANFRSPDSYGSGSRSIEWQRHRIATIANLQTSLIVGTTAAPHPTTLLPLTTTSRTSPTRTTLDILPKIVECETPGLPSGLLWRGDRSLTTTHRDPSLLSEDDLPGPSEKPFHR